MAKKPSADKPGLAAPLAGAPSSRYRAWVAPGAAALFAIAAMVFFVDRLFPDKWAHFHLERAGDLIAAGRLEEGRAQFREVLLRQPRQFDARHQLAQLELRQRRFEHAFLEFQALTEMHPENAEGWLGLAHLLAVSGLPAEAEVAATRALRVAPAHAEAYRFRAELRYQIGRYFGADLDIKKATRLAPSEASAWDLPGKVTAQLKTNAARAHALSQRPHMAAGESGQFWPGSLARLMQGVIQKMQEKKWGEAVTLTRQARETYPGTMVGPWLAALVELGQDRLPEAERLFREAYDVAPRSHRVITGLLRVWARKNGAEVAADRLMELAVRDPEFAYLREVASEVYLQARQPSKAEAALRKGFDLQADSAVPHQQLAELFLVLDRGNEALTVCQKGLERFPNAPELLQLAGQINADLGKPDAAIEAFEAYLSKYPDERWPAGQLAMLLATQRNDAASRQRAKQLIDQLESDAPADAALLDAMGWVHFKLGRIKRARELLVAAAANSEDPSVHYHLAAAYARAKETDRARSELRVALDSARPFAERLDAQRLLRELGS